MEIVGLVFLMPLHLTEPQWSALVVHGVGWIWWERTTRPARHIAAGQAVLPVLLLGSGLWLVFWKTPTCVDAWWLFDQAGALAGLDWRSLLARLPHMLYVNNQPPFLIFWLSRLPVLWAQQLLWFPWALLCVALLFALYGRSAALICATPVFALMIHQPSHDLLLFGTLLIVLRLLQLRQRRWAAVVYGLTYAIKPLTILTAPFILPQLGWYGFLSVGMWGGYVGWSCQYAFGRQQLAFLLHQLMIRSMTRQPAATPAAFPLTVSEDVWKALRFLWKTFFWRWEHLGSKAVQALPFYLFPTYARIWNWRGLILTGMIVLGYGNIKYLLVALLFLFPVQAREENRQ